MNNNLQQSKNLNIINWLKNEYINPMFAIEFINLYIQIPNNPNLDDKYFHKIDLIINEYKNKGYFNNLINDKFFMENLDKLYKLEENPLFDEDTPKGQNFYNNYQNLVQNMGQYLVKFVNIIINNEFILNDLLNKGVIKTDDIYE